MPKITFEAPASLLDVLPKPRPASKFIPDWYKKMPKHCKAENVPPTLQNEFLDDLVGVGTMKSCLPARDYLTGGYIIPSWSDYMFIKDKQEGFINVGMPLQPEDDVANYVGCGTHGEEQVRGSWIADLCDVEGKILKLESPWQIKTPKGYSTLFFSPHYHKCDVKIFPAIVDTDMHHEVNFPFELVNPDKRTHLKYGDPVIQALPFKRDDWESEIKERDEKAVTSFRNLCKMIYRSPYNRLTWTRKKFR